ncbi:hypothetical protein B0H63DRAFT_545969 [Podospora didyma]|uniref:Uncharacterized protein n=1 Tax=Podospora didyma TaxID=330526 RepID=A0AAE0NH30_9PEZI|nr:hypothetical protein B0H63DRAFT_545969 [Podospora didyma]
MSDQISSMEADLGASREKVKKLEEKHHGLRKHFNSAIEEHQTLYRLSKKHCEDTIEKMRASEVSQNAATEAAVKEAEIIREQMLEKVREAVAQNKIEAGKLREEIEALKQEGYEKEAELRKERRASQALAEKLQSLQTANSNFEALTAQNEKIIRKVDEKTTYTGEAHEKYELETQKKLDAVAEHLEGLWALAVSQPEKLTSFEELHQESVNILNSRLDDILESQTATKESTGKLAADVETQMARILKHLNHQQEELNRQLRDKAEENGILSTSLKTKEAECEQREADLEAMKEASRRQMEEIHHLQESLDAMDSVHDHNVDITDQLRAAEAETLRLTEKLTSKETAISGFEAKLQAKDSTYLSDVQRFTESIVKLNQTIQDGHATARIEADQAAETARREARFEIEKADVEARKHLHQAQQERDSLANQLLNLKQDVYNKEQNERRDSLTITSPKNSVSAAEEQGKMVVQEFKQQTDKHEQLRNEDSARIQSLEAELISIREKSSKLEEESQHQNRRAQALSAAVKQWATQEGLAMETNLEEYGFIHMNAEKIGQRFTRILEQLIASRESRALVQKESSRTLSSSRSKMSLERASSPDGFDFVDQEENPPDAVSEWVKAQEDIFKSQSTNIDANQTMLQSQRRVIVCSPADDQITPPPLSIAQEQSRRRQTSQPKSIMKRTSKSISHDGSLETTPDFGTVTGSTQEWRESGNQRHSIIKENDMHVQSSSLPTKYDHDINALENSAQEDNSSNREASQSSQPKASQSADKATKQHSLKRKRSGHSKGSQRMDSKTPGAFGVMDAAGSIPSGMMQEVMETEKPPFPRSGSNDAARSRKYHRQSSRHESSLVDKM